MECAPTLKVEVDRVAFPPISDCGEPTWVPPSLNVTLPVGVPEPGATADTVAVKVTD
jgi:hypothetical protein